MSSDTVDRARALRAAFHDACFAADETLPRDLERLARTHGMATADVEALSRAPARLALYRKLVRGNVTGVASAILERGVAHLERARPGAFAAAVDAYLARGGPRTRHLRDVPVELLVDLIAEVERSEVVPSYVADLLRLDALEFVVGALPDEPTPAAIDVDASRPLVLRGPCRRLVVGHAVHTLTVEPSVPAAETTRLFVHRDAHHRVGVLVLSPFADALVARLIEGAALGVAIQGASAELGVPMSEGLLGEVARWLADFGERGILLGSAP
jgi:hypothetical protein